MKIVVANGCFDVFHAGHVATLQEARAQGDYLIVLLNSDYSVRRLKGPDRPVNAFQSRAAVLRELRSVDAVIGFDSEGELLGLIEQIRPDVLVKGEDSIQAGPIPGTDLLPRWGGRLHLAGYIPGHSTTGIIAAFGEQSKNSA